MYKIVSVLLFSCNVATALQLAGPSRLSGKELAVRIGERTILEELEQLSEQDGPVELSKNSRQRLTQATLLLAQSASLKESPLVPSRGFFEACDSRVNSSSQTIKLMIAAHAIDAVCLDNELYSLCTFPDIMGDDFADWYKHCDQREPQIFNRTFLNLVERRVRLNTDRAFMAYITECRRWVRWTKK